MISIESVRASSSYTGNDSIGCIQRWICDGEIGRPVTVWSCAEPV
jgi:hypothetical protein